MQSSPVPVFEAPPAAPTVTVARVQQDLGPMAVFQRIAAAYGISPLQLARDYASLAFGPGRVSFNDYVRLRLFDRVHWDGCDLRTVVGQRCNRELVVVINYRHDWFGLVTDKIASTSYLAAFGLPTIPIDAIFAPRLTRATPQCLRTREDLRNFLLRDEVYPLFGKPTEGFQSLGSIALRRPHRPSGELEKIGGGRVGLETFLDDITQHYSSGYIFQPFVAPHPKAAALHGERLATARIVTLLEDGEPRIFRAAWKIPSGENLADNYWRSGNLLAKIDVDTGKIGRVISGTGFEAACKTHHPDSGAPFEGASLPQWDEMKAVALEAARVMHHMPMLGWDMGPTSAGPVIVEMNETPDFFLNQFADARGVLEPDFVRFIAAQKRAAKDFEMRMKSDIAKL
ncbi:MAG: sugar-transfer associated ATP-grasp domain-containing protein [Beijerinckiaceae bacterium]